MTERQPTLQALFDADPWLRDATARQEDRLGRLAREQMTPLVRQAWWVATVAGFTPLTWQLVRWLEGAARLNQAGLLAGTPALGGSSLWTLFGRPPLAQAGAVCLLLGCLGAVLLIRGRSGLRHSSLLVAALTTGLATADVRLTFEWIPQTAGPMPSALVATALLGVCAGLGVLALLFSLEHIRRRFDQLTEQNLEIRLELVQLEERLPARND